MVSQKFCVQNEIKDSGELRNGEINEILSI